MSEQDYEGEGNFTARPALCKECRRPIGFRDKKPYDVKFVSDNVYRITEVAHWNTCPVRIKERIEGHCAFCQLEKGSSILVVKGLFGYETCERHGNKNEEFSYHGQTLKHDVRSLELMYQDAMRRKKRIAKKSEKPRGNEGIEVFL